MILHNEQHLLDGGGFEAEPALWCVLEAEHTGLHHTPAQALKAGGGLPPVTVWLRWPDEDEFGPLREMLVLPPCPEQFLTDTVQEEACGLPQDHDGRHGFEFGPPITEADATSDWPP